MGVNVPGAPFEISRMWFDGQGRLFYSNGKDPHSQRKGPDKEGVIALINALEDMLQTWE